MANETIDQEKAYGKRAKARTEQTLLVFNKMYEDVLMAVHNLPPRTVNQFAEKLLQIKRDLLVIQHEIDQIQTELSTKKET